MDNRTARRHGSGLFPFRSYGSEVDAEMHSQGADRLGLSWMWFAKSTPCVAPR